jgi:flagellar biosynthesis component FlhA
MNDSKGIFTLLLLPIIGPAAAISLVLVGGLYIFASLDMKKELRKDAAKAQARIAAKKAAAENRANPDYVDPRAIRLEQLRPKLRTGDAALFREYDAIRKDMIENPDNLPAELR